MTDDEQPTTTTVISTGADKAKLSNFFAKKKTKKKSTKSSSSGPKSSSAPVSAAASGSSAGTEAKLKKEKTTRDQDGWIEIQNEEKEQPLIQTSGKVLADLGELNVQDPAIKLTASQNDTKTMFHWSRTNASNKSKAPVKAAEPESQAPKSWAAMNARRRKTKNLEIGDESQFPTLGDPKSTKGRAEVSDTANVSVSNAWSNFSETHESDSEDDDTTTEPQSALVE